MSIALSIIELVEEEAKKAHAEKIREVELDIGTLSGVEIESLSFAMELAVKDTVMESCKVNINQVAALSECHECGLVFETGSSKTPCPECNGLNASIISGKELKVKSILIE